MIYTGMSGFLPSFFFFLYLDASYIYLDDSALFKLRIYMYMVIFIGIIGIWMFLDIEAAAWDTETAKHKTELKERDEQLLQVKVKALEEKYQEMLKSRKVVHDMKNHLLALKKYDQERDWEGLHQYLNELSDDMLDDSYQIWTGNRMLDMILNQKTKDAKRKRRICRLRQKYLQPFRFQTGRLFHFLETF